MDVNTAFLYSLLSEEVYIEQPEGLKVSSKENWVCKLNCALYGLKQSPRAWFSLIVPTLINFDFQQCEADLNWLELNFKLNQLLVLSTSTSSSNNSYGIDCNRQGST